MSGTNKFKKNDRVQFKGDDKIYIIIRVYASGKSYKYDLQDLSGKVQIEAMPQNTLKKKEI